MTRWEFPVIPRDRAISPEESHRWFAAKGAVLGEDRPDGDRCAGCDAAGCEPCRQADYPPSYDRVYPRCPMCRREQYGPAVIAFSRGDHDCHNCGHVIRRGARLDEVQS